MDKTAVRFCVGPFSKMSNKKQRERLLEKMLVIIRKEPGIRPSKINHILKIPHTAGLRDTLIKRRLVRKKRKGNAVYYYPK